VEKKEGKNPRVINATEKKKGASRALIKGKGGHPACQAGRQEVIYGKTCGSLPEKGFLLKKKKKEGTITESEGGGGW